MLVTMMVAIGGVSDPATDLIGFANCWRECPIRRVRRTSSPGRRKNFGLAWLGLAWLGLAWQDDTDSLIPFGVFIGAQFNQYLYLLKSSLIFQ